MEKDYSNFTASRHWLDNFKRRNGVVSRKVTILTTRPEVENSAATAESIIQFHADYKNESFNYAKCRIWNYDQSGFAYEPSNLRTLSFKGERDTSLMVDSINRHTHSYTVQPMISRDGRLFPTLFIVT